MKPAGAFAKLFTNSELDEIFEYRDEARRCLPSWRAAFGPDSTIDYDETITDILSNEAVERIQSENTGNTWLLKQKCRFLPSSGYSEAASAMAELRCYGALLEAGYEVEPVPTRKHPTPDFKVIGIDGEIFVEVASKQEDAAQTAISGKIAKGETPPGIQRSIKEQGRFKIESVAREHHPFGAPDLGKPDDSTQANAISRLCAIKGKEHQAKHMPTLLWVDLRDIGDWPDVVTSDQFYPLSVSHHGMALTSGCVWYAHYGWKGAPIFEELYGGQQQIVLMGHNGRFVNPANPSKYAGSIICIPSATAYFENPDALHPIPETERLRMLNLRRFDLNSSVASWTKYKAKNQIQSAKELIETLQKAVK